MSVGDTLYAISEAGLSLKVNKTEDILKVSPAQNITSELAAAIRKYKFEIIRVVREDEEMRRTGIIQSERQVFEMAREYFSPTAKRGEA